jgi:hypothetical protein
MPNPKTRSPRKVSPATASRRIRANRHWSRRLLLHPSATFGLLIVGVCLIGMSIHALASDFSVHAVVAAQPLTEGSVITVPNDGAVFSKSPITVSGTCPDESYVKLFRNSAFSGVAICNNGSFSIQTDLFEGRNNLQAQDYNITDAAGPVTEVVQVTYHAPVATSSAGSASTKSSGSANPPEVGVQIAPPILSSDYQFNTATTDQNFIWHLQFQTGLAPFAATINWGDGKSSNMKVPNNDAFTITHHYEKPGYYTILVKATDAQERKVSLQLVALIRRPSDAPISGAILSDGSGQDGSSSRLHWLVYIWPTYLIVAAMVISFWLGERREFLVLTTKTAKAHKPKLRHA